MENVVVVVLALLTGAAGHYELTEFNKTSSDGKVPPIAAGVAGFLVGVFVAMLAPALIVGGLVGVGCYHGVQIFERQAKERLFGMPAIFWSGAAGLVGFFGASIFSVLTGLAASAFAGLAGAFYLVLMEKQRLQADNRMWIAENARLTIASSARGAAPAASAPPAAPVVPPAPVASTPAPARASDALPTRPGAIRRPPAWGPTPHPGASAPSAPVRSADTDFLPHR
jgi:hypothetical protein